MLWWVSCCRTVSSGLLRATTSVPGSVRVMLVWRAVLSQSFREVSARGRRWVGCTVKQPWPKLRMLAPLAAASRSMMVTVWPLLMAQMAWARPMMPAPTIAMCIEVFLGWLQRLGGLCGGVVHVGQHDSA